MPCACEGVSPYAVEVDKVDEGEWCRHLEQFDDANFYQNWAYDAVMWGEKSVSHLLLKQDGVVVAAAQARMVGIPILNAGIAYVLRGPMWRRRGQTVSLGLFEHAMRALCDEYARRRGLLLRVLPNELDRGSGELYSILDNAGFCRRETTRAFRTLVLDIAPSLEQLRKDFRRQWRNNLKKAESHALEVAIGTGLDLYDQFVPLYYEMCGRKQAFEAVDLDKFRAIQQRLPEPLKMSMAVCTFEGEPVAAAGCATAGNTALEVFLATSPKAHETYAAYLLIWRQLEWLKERGMRYFDFGGIDPEKNPGGYQFKSGLSCDDVTHVGEYEAAGSRRSEWLAHAGEHLRERYRRVRQRVR